MMKVLRIRFCSSSAVANFYKLLVVFAVVRGNVASLPTSTNEGNVDCRRPLDFSHPFDENNTIYWLGVKPFRFTKKVVNDPSVGDRGIFYTANEFEAGEHGGTHLDAPYHFNKQGWKTADIPVERLFLVNGIMLDCKKEASLDPDYTLPVDKLMEIEKEMIGAEGDDMLTVIVINFGWADKYGNKTAYYGSPTLNIAELHFPGVSKEAAEWIAKNNKVVGVGIDTPSVDSGKNSLQPVAHVAINGANKFILENMALSGIQNHSHRPLRFRLAISPMKIKEGTGAPCRIFAVPEQCWPRYSSFAP